ncbi:hypothetical protein SDC9_206053 [bioreactor metagenome]|uniref:Uncharacterized protein n=1 Tax=bioreactor metagenome TaxID=1076179 RepID=A0A645J6M3_9ZZZZ
MGPADPVGRDPRSVLNETQPHSFDYFHQHHVLDGGGAGRHEQPALPNFRVICDLPFAVYCQESVLYIAINEYTGSFVIHSGYYGDGLPFRGLLREDQAGS